MEDQLKICDSRSVASNADNNILDIRDGSREETCRLCLEICNGKDQQWGLFDSELPQKLMAFAAVQVQENDGLPEVICTNCHNLVNMSYNFKCQIEKSDHVLRQTLLFRQSTTIWPTVYMVKSMETIHAVEPMVPCIEKSIISSCITIPDEHNNLNNHEQFRHEITNSCNVENQPRKKKESMQSDNNLVQTENMAEIDHATSLGIGNVLWENQNNQQNTTIKFETQYKVKNEQNQNDFITLESQHIEENSNHSDDEKPLILRTKRHKCKYCIKSFANLSLLEKHAVVHKKKSEVTYSCYLCKEQFSSIDKVQGHALAIHSMDIGEDKIMENIKMIQITSWVEKISDDSNEHNLSVENTKENENGNFKCKFCCRQFTYHKPFLAHIRTHTDHSHRLSNKLKKGPDVVDTVLDIANKNTAQNIEVAYSTNKKSFSQFKNYSNAADMLDRYSTDISEDDNDDDDNDDDDDDHDDDDDDDDGDGSGYDEDDHNDDNTPTASIQCNQCGKLVATMRNLKRHLLTHSGLKHNCSICGKDFSRSDKLREHQQLKHKGELFGKSDSDNESVEDNSTTSKKKDKKPKPYKCSLCPKAFAQLQSLANHEERHKRVRDVQKRYLCEVCSKCFAQSGSLVAHMRTHTGVKPYVCNVCSRAFTKSTYLQLHLRTHSGEKPYICEYCSRAFARANTLARHITMHTGEAKYQCQICTKSFRRLTSLNEHTYTHTGQRPYSCKICSKSYNNAGSLYAHTKKCKAIQATTNSMTYPVPLQHSDEKVLPTTDTNAANKVLIFREKKLDETVTTEPTCQFMIAKIHGQKPISTHEPFTIKESQVYDFN